MFSHLPANLSSHCWALENQITVLSLKVLTCLLWTGRPDDQPEHSLRRGREVPGHPQDVGRRRWASWEEHCEMMMRRTEVFPVFKDQNILSQKCSSEVMESDVSLAPKPTIWQPGLLSCGVIRQVVKGVKMGRAYISSYSHSYLLWPLYMSSYCELCCVWLEIISKRSCFSYILIVFTEIGSMLIKSKI